MYAYRLLGIALIYISAVRICPAQTTLTDSLEKACNALPDDTLKVKELYDLAFKLTPKNPTKAWEKTEQLITLSQKIGFRRGVAMAYDVQGNILRARGNYLQAVDKHFAALKLYDSLKYTRGYRTALVNTGTDYSYLKNNTKALEYYFRALALTDTSDYERQVVILNNIGNIYHALKKYDSAIVIYQKALPYAHADTTLGFPAFLYPSIGIVYAEKGAYDTAVGYMLRGMEYQQKVGDITSFAASSTTLGGFYIEMKAYEKAKYHLENAYKAATQTGAKSVIANYYRNMAHLLFRTGNYEDAYTVLNKFIESNDSLITEQHVAQLAESESRFGLEMKERELALANADKALKESELGRQRQLRYALLLVLVVMAVLLLVFYRNIQLKKLANKNLATENTLLQKENILAQYETLRNQVNPHFLFNSLNALASLIKTRPDEAVEFTSVFSRLYRNVLELKDHMVIPLAEELKLVDDYIYLQKIRFDDKLTLEKQIPATVLNMYVPPFCLQMLIENAIKHNIISAEQRLTIQLTVEGTMLIVSNTLQPRQQKQTGTGVGIRNIIERYRIISDILPRFEIINNTYLAKIPLISTHE